MKKIVVPMCSMLVLLITNCDISTNDRQASEQEAMNAQAHAAVGMPAITHFQEKRMAKDIYEKRDQSIATFTYIVNEMSGCFIYLGPSVGYGLPYATQYSPPSKPSGTTTGVSVPLAEPNGLFMPASADGTWVMMLDPKTNNVNAVYIEPRVVVSPFRLTNVECSIAAQTPVQTIITKTK